MQIITTHINADFDSLASMIAAKKLYPEAKLVFPGSQEKNLRYLLKIPEFKIPYFKPKEIDLSKIDHLILVDTRMADRIGEIEVRQTDVRRMILQHVDEHSPIRLRPCENQTKVMKGVSHGER